MHQENSAETKTKDKITTGRTKNQEGIFGIVKSWIVMYLNAQERKNDQFSTTLDEIVQYVGAEYKDGGDIKWVVKNLGQFW